MTFVMSVGYTEHLFWLVCGKQSVETMRFDALVKQRIELNS